MIKQIKDREEDVKKHFAFFPKRIGNKYIVWLSYYYRTWDFVYDGIYSCYIPHDFIEEKAAIKYINRKKELKLC